MKNKLNDENRIKTLQVLIVHIPTPSAVLSNLISNILNDECTFFCE